jgi:CheY-like chemotaxis protein
MSPAMRNTFIILLVEDNPADVRLTQEALKNGKVVHELFTTLSKHADIAMYAAKQVCNTFRCYSMREST